MIKDIPTDTHERLIKFTDDKSGLLGFIAIHNTKLGPATGGTRFKVYQNEDEAIGDALNLSKAMTYKCALAGVPYGGGKAVIMSNGIKSKELLESYARVVDSLEGNFTTGKDVGIGDEDIAHMSWVSPYINGRTGTEDPSIYAALGVFIAMKAAMEKIYGSEGLKDKTVAIKGLGQVGYELARLVSEAGGYLVMSDINEGRALEAQKNFGGWLVLPNDINKAKCDIYAPSALGGEFNMQNVDDLSCKIVCGSANNQLASREVGGKLMDKGIFYIPDYVANAGGLIAVVDGLQHKDYDSERIKSGLTVIGQNVQNILGLSVVQKRPTDRIADELAEAIYG